MSRIIPPSIDDLFLLWEKDSEIDSLEPSKEIINIPILHNKYNKFLSLHKLASHKIDSQINRIKKIKWRYYTGKMSREELSKHSLEPFLETTLKQDLGVYLSGDEELIELELQKKYHEEAISFCTNVMKELNARTYQIKAFMDWEKFINGQH